MKNGHKTKSNSVMAIAMNLMIACLISGVMISGVYAFTNETADRKMLDLRNQIIQTLVQGSDEITTLEGKEDWHVAKKGGEIIAYIVPAESKGYGGSIQMLVAVDTKGAVVNYKITKSNETPGLGDKAGKENFIQQFIGKTKDHLVVTKNPSEQEDIVAISGATITSKAVTNAVTMAVDEVVAYEGGK